MKTDSDRLLALAGIFQAATLTHQIATNGMADATDVETCIYSIFQIDAQDTESVFHDRAHLKIGLQSLVRQLTENDSSRIQVTRYVMQLMVLASKLQKSPDKLEALAKGIESARSRSEHFAITHVNILSQLADLYVKNISPLSAKIMVKGEPLHLNNSDNVSKIRALLLAGVRAAILWLQCGGKRRQMVFSRRKIHTQATEMLQGISAKM
ncbi:MAG: high frequency lysogenization protein HflD [Chromatiales bacterium]|jgi:high frequency lysogenization protein